MASNEVRIIGGKWRGRKLVFPAERHLRPTLGRVRETLFNWLAADVPGSRCLDLFAGSGALGFEALSRGARAVTFVESNSRVARSLEENAARLGADGATVLRARAEQALRRLTGPWDIVFLDPPFGHAVLADLLGRLTEAGCLAPEGLVYVEWPRRECLTVEHWREIKHARAGDTQFGLLASL
jgi:16S rRNA (guanine966-N2)-methyltransferase